MKIRVSHWPLGLPLLGLGGFCLALCASLAHAQPDPPRPDQQGVPRTPEQRRERIRMVRTWRLIDILELSEGQSEQFFLTLKRYDSEEENLSRERVRLSRVLREMIDQPEIKERALLDTMGAIHQQSDLISQAKARFRRDVSKTLSVRQQAKLVLFEERFDSVLGDAIIELMQRRGYPQGMRGPQRQPWGPPGGGPPPEGK